MIITLFLLVRYCLLKSLYFFVFTVFKMMKMYSFNNKSEHVRRTLGPPKKFRSESKGLLPVNEKNAEQCKRNRNFFKYFVKITAPYCTVHYRSAVDWIAGAGNTALCALLNWMYTNLQQTCKCNLIILLNGCIHKWQHWLCVEKTRRGRPRW